MLNLALIYILVWVLFLLLGRLRKKRPATKPAGRSRNLILQLPAFIGFFVFLELGLGVWFYFHQGPFMPNPDRFWQLTPNYVLRGKGLPRGGVRIHNRQGFRDRDLPESKAAGEIRVLCLGDSSTHGFMVTPFEAYPHQLELLLAKAIPGSRVAVLNAGVPGYSSFQGMKLLEEFGTFWQPDLLVISLGFNDSQPVNIADKQLEASPPLVAALRRILFKSRIYLTLRDKIRDRQREAGMLAIDQSGRAWGGNLPRVDGADFKSNLEEMAGWAGNRKIPVVLLSLAEQEFMAAAGSGSIPTIREYRMAMDRLARAPGRARVDMAREWAGKFMSFRMVDSIHTSAGGHREIAQALFETIRERHLLPMTP